MEKSIQDILSSIDDAINNFQKVVPGIQKTMFDELQNITRGFDIKDGKLLNNLKNLKLLGTLQNKLESIIVSPEYKKAVENFVSSYDEVANLNMSYFSLFNKDLKPKNTLPIIKRLAIEATINDLVGQGMSANVVQPVKSLLVENIVTGGSMSDLQTQLSNYLLNNNTGEGALQRYTKQITTDAINQYNAQYQETIAQDLQFSWGQYVGSNITTSREFCIHLTKKRWVNKSELPTIIEGHIDGYDCKLSKTTGLPLGMIPDTTEANFKVRRGGYNCGHQFFWVPDSSVPDGIKKKFVLGPIDPFTGKINNNKTGVKVSDAFKNIDPLVKKSVENALSIINSVHDDGVLKKIPVEAIDSMVTMGAFSRSQFTNAPVKIEISTKGTSQEMTFAHELGHYLDLFATGKTQTSYTSEKLNNDEMSSIMAAIKSTDTIKKIVDKSNEALPFDALDYLEYLLRPREMWARAYAQYIAVKSQDSLMIKQLEILQNDVIFKTVQTQWNDNEFKSIIQEIDKYFSDKNWI